MTADGREGDDVEDDEEEPRLPRRHRALLFGGILGAWALAMLALGVRWWDLDEHGPWLTPLTPLVLGGAVEQALLARRPEWARDAGPAAVDPPLRGAAALGERARPYWARTPGPDDDDRADGGRGGPEGE